MCKMRIVITDQDHNVEKDFIADLPHIEINIIDRPAYCLVLRKNVNGYCNILYKYANSKEETLDINTENNNIFLVVGVNSGCFYSLCIKLEFYQHTDLVSLCQEFSEKYKQSPKRFHDNLTQFRKLTKAILMKITDRDKQF